MDRQQAKKLLPIIQAFAEGKTIQTISTCGEWADNYKPLFNCDPGMYRIKPKSRYRPFKNAEECWNEMEKHQPFGWIKSGNCYYNVVSISYIDVNVISLSGIVATLSFSNLVEKEYHFVDGAIFGIKVEE